jgi:hypothetical protein
MNKIPILLAGAVALAGCGEMTTHFTAVHQGGPHIKGSGRVKTESRRIGSFSKVRSEGAMDVVATIGPKSDLKITADDNLLKLVKTRIEGDTLVISGEGSYSTRSKMEVSFSVPALRSASLKGSSDIYVKGLKSGDFDAAISGSGDIFATGSVRHLTVALSGSGDCECGKLIAQSATVALDGSGDVRVNTKGPLSATINGSGDITYVGQPSSISKTINGSGGVHGG